MNVTVVAILCHAVSGIPAPACHEEIVTHVDSIQACMLFPANLAQWKEHGQGGRFADDEWTISKVRCIPGSYEKRDAI